MSPELAAFVREHVRSVWALELLVILSHEPTRLWRQSELVAELRGSASLVADNLSHFQRAWIALEPEPDQWRFAPASPVLASLVRLLTQAYRERPVTVVNMIARSNDRIQGLADAFKWKGET